jgi:hypothetical protein
VADRVQPEPTNRIGPSLQVAPPDPRQPLASFTRPLIKLVLGPCFGIAALLLLLVPAVNSGVFWWARILAGLACVVVVGVMARILALAIIAEPGQLVIRNFRNTHRIPWTEIEDIFETPPPPPSVYLENPLYTQKHDVLVRLHDGSMISSTLYGERIFRTYPDDRKKVVDRLNELRREHQGNEG